MSTAYDAANDVLYVLREGASIHRSRSCPHDDYTVLGADASGAIVGLTLLFASDMTLTLWQSELFRGAMPPDVWQLAATWFADRERGAV